MIALRYDCDRSALGPELAARFKPLEADHESERFIAQYGDRPYGVLSTRLMELGYAFASSYDVHGLFGAYPMHMLSALAFADLLEGRRVRTLLDIGAGAGYVTERARGHADDIVCTETSAPLARRLRARGFVAEPLDLTVDPLGRRFELVCCFNVLDRTARPLSLLRAARDHLDDGGRLLLSIPLPVTPHVHVKGGTVAPRERLPSLARQWELAARELSEQLFPPLDLTVQRLARAPYLSRGDRHAPLYALDAAIWLLTRT
jgi:SAM-dependent methyltransferase